jgi:nucleoside-diphosphate-sugar epimerase
MKNRELHVVLGANGAMGQAVIAALQAKDLTLRAVTRSGSVEGVETRHADLRESEASKRAVEGASHVYLCVGLPYRAKVWARDWPRIMQNVIDACLRQSAVLVFLDNVYMYGPPPLSIPFDEGHPQHPTSRKGKARRETADLLLRAISERGLKAVIGRSADFYGPGAANSPFYISFLERMLRGKAPQSIYPAGLPHTYAYTPDNGRALVELALNPDTYGQVWHLPVGEELTIDQICMLFNREMSKDFKVSYMSDWLLAMLSLFIPILGEVKEMRYRFQGPYLMSGKKFRNRFPDFRVTPYQEGVETMVNSF